VECKLIFGQVIDLGRLPVITSQKSKTSKEINTFQEHRKLFDISSNEMVKILTSPNRTNKNGDNDATCTSN